MSTWRVTFFSVFLIVALSVPAFAATPWISVIDPNPQTLWQKETESMVPNTDPLTVWQSGNEYMVVWDSAGLTGNVKIDLLKDGRSRHDLVTCRRYSDCENGKGFLKTMIYASAGPGQLSNPRFQSRNTRNLK